MNGLISIIIVPLMMVITALARGEATSWTLLSQQPRLDWVDPQQAMKGNFNGLIAMVLPLPLVLFLVLSAFLLSRLGQGYNGIMTLLALELVLAGLATTRLLEGTAEKRFRGMEQ